MRMARRFTPAVCLTLLLAIGDSVLAQPNPAPTAAEDQRLLPYVKPGQLVDIGGRRINLRCTGTGGPTECATRANCLSWIFHDRDADQCNSGPHASGGRIRSRYAA
jgi:hypothetical protein